MGTYMPTLKGEFIPLFSESKHYVKIGKQVLSKRRQLFTSRHFYVFHKTLTFIDAALHNQNSPGNMYLFVMDCLANGQTGRNSKRIFLEYNFTATPDIGCRPTNRMNVYVFTCYSTEGDFNVSTQNTVEYKEFFIFRHILCAKCNYLICIDLLLECAQVMKIFFFFLNLVSKNLASFFVASCILI